MKWITREDRWERGFAALSKFRRRKGHCFPSRHHLEGKFTLGAWVSRQRYVKDKLSAERKRRLDKLGFDWGRQDDLWERGFANLLKFKRREGHCRVPAVHKEENYNLGYWVSTQRRNRKEMSAERKARLNKVGFEWKPKRGRPLPNRRTGT
jgi:Helicase associated domain